MSHATQGFSTRSIHVGQKPEATYGAMIPPIYMTSTYIQEWPAQTKAGHDYTRAGNPNFDNLEAQIATLENAKFATVFSAGLAAFTALVSGMKHGDCVVAFKSLYGGTYRLFTRVFEPLGIELHLVQVGDWEGLEKIMVERKPKYVIFETPTNPLLEVIDIERVVRTAHQNGVHVVVDNTFATPFHQNPLDLGADCVIHSATKYLGGHSDVVGGVCVTNDPELKKKVDFARMALGLNPSPFDTWLVARSIKTLAVRMERHSKSAQVFAEWLEQHPMIAKVFYPGLKSHPCHAVAARQMKKGFSGMVSAEFKLSLEQTKKFMASCRVFSLAESLGGVESLVDHPASMTHASIPAAERKAIGLEDGLVRFSVGLEDVEDLMSDVEQALKLAQEYKA